MGGEGGEGGGFAWDACGMLNLCLLRVRNGSS